MNRPSFGNSPFALPFDLNPSRTFQVAQFRYSVDGPQAKNIIEMLPSHQFAAGCTAAHSCKRVDGDTKKKRLNSARPTPRNNWCLGRESNSYRDLAPRDFKSLASTYSATQAVSSTSIHRVKPCQAVILRILSSRFYPMYTKKPATTQ